MTCTPPDAFLFGIGAGWLKEETEIMGGDFPHRWTQTREAILAMKSLWTEVESEYHGRYYDFPPVYSFPRSVQRPHPPVYLGGMARNVFKRIVEWGDGWMPNRVTPDDIRSGRQKLDALAVEAGRAPDSISISVFGQPADRDLISDLFDAGADRVMVPVETADVDEDAAFERLSRIAEAVLF